MDLFFFFYSSFYSIILFKIKNINKIQLIFIVYKNFKELIYSISHHMSCNGDFYIQLTRLVYYIILHNSTKFDKLQEKIQVAIIQNVKYYKCNQIYALYIEIYTIKLYCNNT